MELIPEKICMLCDVTTGVLASDCLTPYVEYMNTTFFDNNKNGLDCFQEVIANRSCCILCSHKIVISHTFKGSYEEICKKHTSFKKTRAVCFICESKSVNLILTDDNPNDFFTKIKTFMDSTLFSRPYLQCAICWNCLFDLNIWFEMNLLVAKKIDGKQTGKPTRKQTNSKKSKIPYQNHTPNTNDGLVHTKGKENITPPKRNHILLKKSLLENESAAQKRKRNSAEEISEATQQSDSNHCRNASNISKNPNNEGLSTEVPRKLHLFLKRTLKNLKPVKKISNQWPENILIDKKMFSSVPYVLMVKDVKQATAKNTKAPKRRKQQVTFLIQPEDGMRKSSRLNKPIEVIDLDSDNEDKSIHNNGDEMKEKASNSPVMQKRSILSLRKQKLIKTKVSSNNSDSEYICNICDKGFKANYEYKAHCLWHEKPDNVIINVARQKLPNQTKASLFNAHLTSAEGEKQIPQADKEIDKLVQKYVTIPSDTFEDTDFNNSKDIENIIEQLDSEEKEQQPEDSSKLDKNGETNLEDQNIHEDSEKENNIDDRHSEESDCNNSKDTENIEKLNSQEKEQTKDDEPKNKEIHLDGNKSEDSTNETDLDEQHSENETDPEVDNVEKVDESKESAKKSEEKQLENQSKENKNQENKVDIPEESCEGMNESEIAEVHETSEKCSIEDDVQPDLLDDSVEDNIEDADSSQPTENEQNSAESDIENGDDDNEKFVEMRLAKIHGIEDSLDSDATEIIDNNSDYEEKEQANEDEREKQESSKELNESNDNDSISDDSELDDGNTNNYNRKEESDDCGSEEDNVEDKKEESNENHKKRKRVRNLTVVDDNQEESACDEIVTPKAKKVRFAMDYQTPKSVNEDFVSEELFDEEQKDEDCRNSSDDILLGNEDDNKVE